MTRILRYSLAIVTLLTFALPRPAQAQGSVTVGNPGPNAGWTSNGWTGVDGQTFVTPSGYNVLSEFSILLDFPSGWPFAYTPMSFRTYITEWSGTGPIGPVLYRSSTQIAPTVSGPTWYNFSPTGGLVLDPSTTYLFFLTGVEESVNALGASPLAFWGMSSGPDYVGGGNVVTCCAQSIDGFSSTTWYENAGDKQFQARFTTVPEPSSFLLVLVAGASIVIGRRYTRRYTT